MFHYKFGNAFVGKGVVQNGQGKMAKVTTHATPPSGCSTFAVAFEALVLRRMCETRAELVFACFGLQTCTARLERKRQHVGVPKESDYENT
jgi:hypothetical protein